MRQDSRRFAVDGNDGQVTADGNCVAEEILRRAVRGDELSLLVPECRIESKDIRCTRVEAVVVIPDRSDDYHISADSHGTAEARTFLCTGRTIIARAE